jgi:hypothetical protein
LKSFYDAIKNDNKEFVLLADNNTGKTKCNRQGTAIRRFAGLSHSIGFALSISMIGISSFISYNSLHFSQTSPELSFNFTGPLHCGQAKISNRSLFIIFSHSYVFFILLHCCNHG